MSSWTVTWGIIQALALLALIDLIVKFVSSAWFSQGVNAIVIVCSAVILGCLTLIVMAKAG